GIYDVYQYDKITIKDVYPGIDWVLYNSDKKGMKYDFVVHPGADASQIKLIYEGDKSLKLNDDGSLSQKTALGTLTENAPYSYIQENNTEVNSRYKLTKIYKHLSLVEFDINQSQSQNQTLIIDPQLTWGTFYGGSGVDEVWSLSTDQFGNLYVTGAVDSPNFPTLNPIGGAYFQGAFGGGNNDVFILKFSNTGLLLWSTYYGDIGSEYGLSINTDISGNVFVTGSTDSPNFPTWNPGTPGIYFQGTFALGSSDAFILKFNSSGLRLWATYYGGIGGDSGFSVCTDLNGNVFVTGFTSSVNFPTWNPGTPGIYFQGAIAGGADAFILKFSNTGALQWATYYGGSGGTANDYGFSVSIDISSNVFVTGRTESTNFPTWNPGTPGIYFQGAIAGGADAFILKFSNTGALQWATHYGGSGNDEGYSIACDNTGNVFVMGQTTSTNFPIFNPSGGAYFQGTNAGGGGDAFILKFSNTGVHQWATYYGGTGTDVENSFDNLTLDNCGAVYICFSTSSTNIPTQSFQAGCGGFNDNSKGSGNDLFLVKFSNTGVRIWATYIGGNGTDYNEPIVCDANNNLFVSGKWTGVTNSATYPLANPGGGAYYDATFNGGNDDSFFMKFTPIPPTYAQSQTNPVGCSNCNGVATVSVICGEAPYTYQWSNAVTVSNTTLTTSSISGLCPGVYQVTVTSNCNYTYTTTYTLTGSVSNLTVNATVQNANCTSPTGSVIINSVTNGLPNYTLTQGTTTLASGFTTPYTLNNVSVGTHTYTLYSANGCSTTFTVTVLGAANSLTLSPMVTDAICGTGTVSIGITGGTPNYTITEGATTVATGSATSYTLTGVSVGSHTYVVSSTNSCNQTLIVNILDLCVLPVQLTKFSASCADRKATIKWTTATEINCDSFLLYRRTNHIDFAAPIAKVKGSVNSYTVNNYEVIDNNLEIDSIYYYKLEQVDLDKTVHEVGQIIYAHCVPVKFNYNFNSYLSGDVLTIISNKNLDNVTIGVYTVLGQTLITLNNVNLKNGEAFKIDVSNLAEAVYFIKIFNSSEQGFKKFVIGR
ncbi:MAG: SBBP repeat-containing protein, partial [Bacteroidota bacterium]